MATLQNGSIFARDFRIVKPLRSGGMGTVYVVDQLSTGKQRALKVMAPEIAQDPAVRDRFILEARAASRIESDHVVEIVTAGIDDETQNLYLVMELLRGEELADAVERTGALPHADVADILSQLGHALAQAHMQGIVHRDLKPENVFLAASKRQDSAFTVKVLDFGIAKLVEDGMQKTGTQPLGSPLYMSPEQTDRKGRICPQTDVWALGLFAFFLLTARSYWRDAEEGSLASLIRAICLDPLPLASERAAEMGLRLPQGFDAWFSHCVDRNIDARYRDAGEAVRAFATLPLASNERKLVVQAAAFTTGLQSGPMTGSPVRSGPANVSHAAFGPTVVGDSQFVGASTAPGGAPTKRGSGILFALLALGAGGLLAAGYFVWLRPKTNPAASASSSATAAAIAPSGSASASVAVAPAGQCPDGMIYHPAGSMIMGAKDGSDDAKPPHKVSLGAFCLDKTEVTAAAYASCVDSSDCEKPPQDVDYDGVTPEARTTFRELCTFRNKDFADHPINCVDWKMAETFCTWKKGALPTEAQWEYAARGTSQRDFPWGDEAPSADLLNACGSECVKWGADHHLTLSGMYDADDGFFGTAPVGHYPKGASALGVLDLAGNVWEWTADWYGPYSDAPSTDPTGPASGDARVIRGGAFNGSMVDWAKPSYRYRSRPNTYNHGIGFRCASKPNE